MLANCCIHEPVRPVTGLAGLEAAALAGNRVAQHDLGVAYAAGTALPADSHK